MGALLLQPEALKLSPVPGAPRLTQASCESLRQIQVVDERGSQRVIQIPAERALTVCIDGRELVTLMTLGACPELLVLGYLYNQRLITRAAQLESITVDWERSAALVKSRTPLPEIEARSAGRIVTTGCGQGTVLSNLRKQIDDIRLPATTAARIGQSSLLALLDTMHRLHSIHRTAGSVHGCALFHGAELWLAVEDVGRHNALDTITGWMLLHAVAGADKILFTTARLSGEMVIKAAQCGIPIVVSRNGISGMAYDLAAELRMTLIGRAANRHFLCYVGADRFDAEPQLHPSALPTAAD